MKNSIVLWLSRCFLWGTVGLGLYVLIQGLVQEGEMSDGGFVRYLMGWALILALVGGLGWLYYRWVFRQYYSTPQSGYFWVITAGTWWLAWLLLEWRTEFDPDYHDENIVVTGLLGIVWFLICLLLDYFRSRRQEIRWLQEKTEAELHLLKAQIKPHFFFNTLNVVYGSALKSQDDETAHLIQQMGGLLRFTWYEAQNTWVPVEKEVTFLKQYLHLQQARLLKKESIQISLEIEWDEEPSWIAPLLLIPGIENAFQYAVTYEQPCYIRGKIQLEDGICRFHCINSLSSNHLNKKGTGTGLKNMRQRLHLLYPHQHTLSIQESEEQFEIQLTFPLHASEPSQNTRDRH